MFIKAQNQNSGTTGHWEWFNSMPLGSTMCPLRNKEFNTSGILQDIFNTGQGLEKKKRKYSQLSITKGGRMDK